MVPEVLEHSQVYTLALQKKTAYNAERYLPAGVSLSEPVALDEVWATLDAYARSRTDRCLHLDTDAPLDVCP